MQKYWTISGVLTRYSRGQAWSGTGCNSGSSATFKNPNKVTDRCVNYSWGGKSSLPSCIPSPLSFRTRADHNQYLPPSGSLAVALSARLLPMLRSAMSPILLSMRLMALRTRSRFLRARPRLLLRGLIMGSGRSWVDLRSLSRLAFRFEILMARVVILGMQGRGTDCAAVGKRDRVERS
jgi:hypothetical protein